MTTPPTLPTDIKTVEEEGVEEVEVVEARLLPSLVVRAAAVVVAEAACLILNCQPKARVVVAVEAGEVDLVVAVLREVVEAEVEAVAWEEGLPSSHLGEVVGEVAAREEGGPQAPRQAVIPWEVVEEPLP